MVARSSTRASESKPSRVSHQRKVARRAAVEGHRLPAHDHLDYDQLSGLAIGTLHPDLLPVSRGVDCRPPAGHPCETRRTATDCIGRSMWGPLAVQGLAQIRFRLSAAVLVARSGSGAGQRMAVEPAGRGMPLTRAAQRRPLVGPRPFGPEGRRCRPPVLSSPPVPARTGRPCGRRKTNLSAPSGCRHAARTAASALPCPSRHRAGHRATRTASPVVVREPSGGRVRAARTCTAGSVHSSKLHEGPAIARHRPRIAAI